MIARSGLCLAIFAALAASLPAQVDSLVIQGSEIESFLRQAEIVEARTLGIGVTFPKKVTMVWQGQTQYGVFKSIDDYKSVMRFEDGRIEVNFQDTWMSEIAAYEIDKIIGLRMVPATVERTYKGEKGSVQFWVDPMMSEAERRSKGLRAPDTETWNRGMFKTRLFDNMVYNTDRNLQNLLITREWEIVLIDHSRAFRPLQALRAPRDLTRFSRSLLEGLERLNIKILTERTGKYLPKPQIEGILKRRDQILDLARKLALQNGEMAVYYP